MKLEAVFIDRDGTIGGTGRFIHPKDFSPYPFSLEAIRLLQEAGLKLFAFTNQHRISRGEATLEDFNEEFAKYGLDQAYICPHEPEERCRCHKPATGMLEKAAMDHGIRLDRSVVIGDVGSTDMQAAAAVRATKIIVRTGWGEASLGDYRHTWADVEPDYIASNLLDAAHWIRNYIA